MLVYFQKNIFKIFCLGTPTWRPWRHMQTLYGPRMRIDRATESGGGAGGQLAPSPNLKGPPIWELV